jgi:hypothetical protein
MRAVLALVLVLAAGLARADTCAEIRAAYLDDAQAFVTLVRNRVQTFGSVPPNGLAWTSAPPVHPEGAGTGVTLVAPDWDARNLDQCGDPVGLSWRDLNIQPAQPSPLAFKLDQYAGPGAQGQEVGFTLTFALVCNGTLRQKTVVVEGTQIWREGDDW